MKKKGMVQAPRDCTQSSQRINHSQPQPIILIHPSPRPLLPNPCQESSGLLQLPIIEVYSKERIPTSLPPSQSKSPLREQQQTKKRRQGSKEYSHTTYPSPILHHRRESTILTKCPYVLISFPKPTPKPSLTIQELRRQEFVVVPSSIWLYPNFWQPIFQYQTLLQLTSKLPMGLSLSQLNVLENETRISAIRGLARGRKLGLRKCLGPRISSLLLAWSSKKKRQQIIIG